MKNIKTIIVVVMIFIPILMYVYMSGVNKGVKHTTENYIDSIDNMFDNIALSDTNFFNIEELKDFNLDVSEFDLDKFKLNNGFDLKELYKDNIEFYTLDTMDIESFDFEELEMLGFTFYLYDLDSVLYDSYYILIVSREFSKVISLYNTIPPNEIIRSNDDLYKIVLPPTILDKSKMIENIYKMRIRGKKIRMMMLK